MEKKLGWKIKEDKLKRFLTLIEKEIKKDRNNKRIRWEKTFIAYIYFYLYRAVNY